MSVSVTSSNFTLVTSIAIVLLIFVSIIPLACADVWTEAAVFTIIFVLSGANIFQNSANKLEIENRRLLAPLLILALYSIFQGLSTVLMHSSDVFATVIFPESFDSTASAWSAVKIVGLAVFLRLLFQVFRRRVDLLGWGLIFIGNFFAVFGIARFLLQDIFHGVIERLISPLLATGVGFGTYFNQNHFAYLMLMVFGLNIGVFCYANQSKRIRYLLLGASALVWTALVLTGSRGGIVSSFAEIAILIFLPILFGLVNNGKNFNKIFPFNINQIGKRLTIFGIIFICLVIGIILIGQDRVVGRFEEIPEQITGITNTATYRRIDVWRAAVEIIKQYPVYGIGFGGFRIAVSQYIDISGNLVPNQAHNDYLEFVASGGAIGVFLAAWFLFRFYNLVKKRLHGCQDSFSYAVRIGAICGMAGVALHSFFDFGLQITANLLFLAGLLFLAVHEPLKSENESASVLPPRVYVAVNKFFYPLVYLIIASFSAFFGFTKYEFERSKAAPNLNFVENERFRLPFDASYYDTRAAVYNNFGNFADAADELSKAIIWRPKDYNLWLRQALLLGRIQGRETEAENAFRRAIELAPYYGAPHFYYGNFLIKNHRKNEGISELRTASRRNPNYFDYVLGQVKLAAAENKQEAVEFLLPLDSVETEKLAASLLEGNEYQPFLQIISQEVNLSDENREMFVVKLLEKKRYSAAYQIYHRNYSVSGDLDGNIEDGDFEARVLKNAPGFGWRTHSSDDKTSFAFDKDSLNNDGYSLRFDFKGSVEETLPLLSQIVLIEKRHLYQLHFSHKSSGIAAENLPILQIIFKHSDSENIVKEANLSHKEAEWSSSTIEFETTDEAEAVEIKLARKPRSPLSHPVYGQLWLDNFYLQKKN